MNAPTPGIGFSERVYTALWMIYPSAFRHEYGDDALELFRDRYREAHATKGMWGVLRLWIRTVPNVLVHGTLERLGATRSAWSGGQAARAFGSAGRTLARSPLLSGTIVLTLAIGIGSTVALFSIVRRTSRERWVLASWSRPVMIPLRPPLSGASLAFGSPASTSRR